jgi:uncharacterized protein (DUF433 family)
MRASSDRVLVDPTVMLGKPVIRGTRITVELVLRKLSEAASTTELLGDYPHLTDADVRVAIRDALRLVRQHRPSREGRDAVRDRSSLRAKLNMTQSASAVRPNSVGFSL